MERIGQYKKKTTGFGNLEEAKLLRALQGLERRKRRRSDLFTSNRDITEPSTSPEVRPGLQENEQRESDKDNNPAAQISQDDRATKLAKWRAERELHKKLQQMKQPAFRTGVYTHKLDSPIFLHQLKPAVKQSKAAPIVPRVTRATAKRLAAKNSTANTPSAGAGSSGVKKVTLLGRGAKNVAKKNVAKNNLTETSFAPQNHQFRAPDGLPLLPLFGQEALESVENDTAVGGAVAPAPIYFSPYVVTARGKRASRIEQMHSLNTSNSIIDKMEEEEALEMKKKNDQSIEEDRTVGHFRKITDAEVTRLKARCYDWMVVKSNPDILEDAALIINQAIGQTNLLINKKIQQFRKLIDDCEAGSGDKLVTCDDLQGFWDMIYMQVRDCDSRFDKLAKLQADDWIERGEEKAVTKPTVKKKTSVTAVKKNTSRCSSVRQMILAARKKKMETQANSNSPDVLITETKKPSPIAESSRLSSVKFDGGFFVVESPQKSATPRGLKKASLAIPKTPENLSSSKLRRSALSAIKISQLLKPLEVKIAEPEIACVNRGQTPGRSILKKADSTRIASCAKKSQNKVNFSKREEKTEFNCDDTVPKMDCTEDLSSADLLVKKKLEYLYLSSSESEPEEQHAACSQVTASGTRIPQIEELEQVEQTAKDIDQLALSKETNIQSTKTDDHKENHEPNKLEITKRRRSTRKSVKFTGEECTACMETKPVLPMTPGSKRRTSKNPDKESLKSENTQIETPIVETKSGDLISWETPSQVPQRVRRSLRIKTPK